MPKTWEYTVGLTDVLKNIINYKNIKTIKSLEMYYLLLLYIARIDFFTLLVNIAHSRKFTTRGYDREKKGGNQYRFIYEYKHNLVAGFMIHMFVALPTEKMRSKSTQVCEFIKGY